MEESTTVQNLELNYDYWTADDILKAILPCELQLSSSFESIGHIAHLNLRDDLMPYRYIVGSIIMDKSPTVKTVVTKIGTIENQFRTFPMEVLAGVEDYQAEVRENDCRFKMDFSRVYWNSRLHGEHERLIKGFQKGDVVCDVFAGIGPFAVPAAKKGCLVLANDLNPASFEYLQHNIRLNKLSHATVHTHNLDGREFIRKSVGEVGRLLGDASTTGRTHYVMNLPAIALEFLDAFRGAYSNDFKGQMPLIHCHCFTKNSEEPVEDIRQRAEEALGCQIPADDWIECHHVRKVAPNKEMYCLTFRLQKSVAFNNLDNNESSLASKRQKTL